MEVIQHQRRDRTPRQRVPAPTHPFTWRAGRDLPGRVARLGVGLLAFGVGIVLQIRAGLGLGPWDVLHVGLSQLTGLSLGAVMISVGVLLVAATTALGDRPGPGTLANMVLIGVFVDLIHPWVPAARGTAWAWTYLLSGILLFGAATGLYIGAAFGKGPRDAVMIVLAERTGWTVRRVRTALETTVLALGWALGGTVGVGTIVFALTIGPAVHAGLHFFAPAGRPAGALPPPPHPAPAGRQAGAAHVRVRRARRG